MTKVFVEQPPALPVSAKKSQKSQKISKLFCFCHKKAIILLLLFEQISLWPDLSSPLCFRIQGVVAGYNDTHKGGGRTEILVSNIGCIWHQTCPDKGCLGTSQDFRDSTTSIWSSHLGIHKQTNACWRLIWSRFSEMSTKLKCHQNWNVTKTQMSPKPKCYQKWKVTKTEMSQKLKWHQNWNVTKTEMSPKQNCHQNWDVTKTEMSP